MGRAKKFESLGGFFSLKKYVSNLDVKTRRG
jgi:hypothetical protein